MNFKLRNKETAVALSAYWSRTYRVATTLISSGDFWAIQPVGEYPACWREICEAYSNAIYDWTAIYG